MDGLRAIAVLAVIAYHAPEITFQNFTLFKGGYLGVDIFFVISGYLISSIIFKELRESGNFSFKNFYERRIRRIIPVLFFLVLFTYFFSYFLLLPTNFVDFSKSSLSTLGFGSNFYFYFQNLDYSQFTGLKKPLLHTWSLSIEEQFYIFYPLFLFLIFKKFRTNFLNIFWIIFILSFLISYFQTEKNQILSFYSLHSRIWEFAAGALTAIYLNKNNFYFSKNINNIVTLLGFFLIIWSILFLDHQTKHPSYLTIIPVIGTCAIILFSSEDNLIKKILSLKIFVWIGLISYSLYMWHYPIFAYADLLQFIEGDIFAKDFFTGLIFIFLIFFISIISFFLIEKPFRRKSFKFNNILKVLLAVLLINISLNTYTLKLEGKINNENIELESFKKTTYVNSNCKFFSDKKEDFFIEDNNDSRFEDCKKKYNKFVLVLGDSHAGNLYNSISKTTNHKFILGLIKDACRPSAKERCHYDNAEKFIKKEIKNIDEIIITHKGSFFLTNTGNPNNENYTPARKLPIIKSEIEETTSYLKKINKVFPVIFVGPHIEPNIPLTKKNIKYLISGGDVKTLGNNINYDLIKVDSYLKEVMKKNDIKYISKIDQLNFDLDTDYVIGDKITFNDPGHWSNFGETYFGKKLINNSLLKTLNKNYE